MVKISIVMSTARRDYSMVGLPNIHQFDMFLNSLMNQTFPHDEFEVVIVDMLKDKGIKTVWGEVPKRIYDITSRNYDFIIKHISPFPSFWLDNNLPAYCGSYNKGIIFSDGELIVITDDCSEWINRDILQIYWDIYKKYGGKAFGSSIYEYWEGTKPMRHLPDAYPSTTKMYQIMRSDNYDMLVKDNIIQRQNTSFSANGYYSFSLESILELNGYNQLFDGAKGLEDCDLMRRMTNAGYTSVYDIRLRIIEHHHEPVVLHALMPFVRSNGPIMDITLKYTPGIVQSNKVPLSQEDIDYILNWHETDKYNLKVPITQFLKDTWEKQVFFNLGELRKERIDNGTVG
jgi:hypothetical protein